jgi:hypothetical protein
MTGLEKHSMATHATGPGAHAGASELKPESCGA